MEGRFLRVFLTSIRLAGVALGLLLAQAAWSQDDPLLQPDLPRRTVSLPAIDSENFELSVFAGSLSVEDFGVNPVLGTRLAFHMSEDFFLEAAYAVADTQKTSYERLSGVSLLTDSQRKYSYYNVSLGINVLQGEAFIGKRWAFNNALYLIGGAGSTRFAGDKYFTFNVGAGYRLLLTDWFALHLDVRDHLYDTDLLGEHKTVHNLETVGGVAVFF